MVQQPVRVHAKLSRDCLVFALNDSLLMAFPYLFFGSVLVVAGAIIGQFYVVPGSQLEQKGGFIGLFSAWDGRNYVEIAKEGYSYSPDRRSNVAFFPALPLSGRLIAAATGWRMDFAILIASYAFLTTAFAMAGLYIRDPFSDSQSLPPSVALDAKGSVGENPQEKRDGSARFVLLAFAFFPTTFYFRMAYTESFFVLEVILVPHWHEAKMAGLGGLRRLLAWPRPHGRLGLPCSCLWFGIYGTIRLLGELFWLRVFLGCRAACWGLAAYMLFLYLAFGNALAFAQTQQHWEQRPAIPLAERLGMELLLEPIDCVYDPSCPCHLLHQGEDPSPLFSMYYGNPVFFLLFGAFLAFGAMKGWLNRAELWAGTALLLFSYLSKGYSNCMCSQARFASTVFPVYIVMGKILERLPGPVVGMIVGLSGFFLGAYSALFVRWYGFY